MSFLFSRAANLDAFHPPAPGMAGRLWGGSQATPREQMRIGAVWASLRLRADLISTLPVDVFRRVAGRQVEVPRPVFFGDPQAGWLWNEWVYASQMDLDRYGNSFGFVAARGGDLRPSQVELTDAADWSIVMSSSGAWEYQYRGAPQKRADVWHERQYVTAGMPLGLSPVAHAAWTAGHYLAAQQFALDWFTSGGSPSGVLRNSKKQVDPGEAGTVKTRFRAAVSRRDVFVTGNDWEYTPAAAASSDAKFLDAMKATIPDVCRFYGVPADMIDAEVASGGVITYQNATQRNLQLLTINLGPAISRREARWTHDLVAGPRYVKLNTDAMLRMDAKGKLEVIASGVGAKLYTHDEGRDLLDLEPLTDAQIAKMHAIEGTAPKPGEKTGVTP